MFNAKSSLYAFIAFVAVAVVACQPAEGPLERAGKAVDNAGEKAGEQLEKAGDKINNAVEDAKK